MPGICGAGKCKNLLGSYECICDDGYRRDTFGRCDGMSVLVFFSAIIRKKLAVFRGRLEPNILKASCTAFDAFYFR